MIRVCKSSSRRETRFTNTFDTRLGHGCSFERGPKSDETDASMSGVTRIKVKCPFTKQRKSFTSSADGIL